MESENLNSPFTTEVESIKTGRLSFIWTKNTFSSSFRSTLPVNEYLLGFEQERIKNIMIIKYRIDGKFKNIN